MEKQRLAMQTPYVFQIPVPNEDEEAKGIVTRLVEQILTLRQANPSVDTSTLEEEIDSIVYRLYQLSNDEVQLIETRATKVI